MFVDIALHGNSKSTVRLRTHGVDQTKVEDIVKQLGWQILKRKRDAQSSLVTEEHGKA